MDWIAAFFECSLAHTALVLSERVKLDIEAYLKRMGPETRVHVSAVGPKTVITKPVHLDIGPWVTIEPKENYILVRRAKSQNVGEDAVQEARLTPAVNGSGECRLRLNSEELEIWQASRFILEPLLFG